MLVTSFMIIFAMPAVMLGEHAVLIIDRLVGTHFFNPAEGGDALLWQHLFWFFGHPEVYIIFIPALGIVSSIIATFARRPIFGYPAMVLSLIATGFLGFGLWVHHMFATGLPQLGESFFTAASMMIAIPSGVQIFCWIATLWDGRPRFATPLLFVLGFFVIFVLGGLTGVMLASVPLDLQVHDTFFVVAHFHYVLIGGAVFPLFGGVLLLVPEDHRPDAERDGRASGSSGCSSSASTSPSSRCTSSGCAGMPRRVYTYPAEPGLGHAEPARHRRRRRDRRSACCVFLVNVVVSLRRGAIAGDNPWDAATLEWATSSPPPRYNFAEMPGRHRARSAVGGARRAAGRDRACAATGARC